MTCNRLNEQQRISELEFELRRKEQELDRMKKHMAAMEVQMQTGGPARHDADLVRIVL